MEILPSMHWRADRTTGISLIAKTRRFRRHKTRCTNLVEVKISFRAATSARLPARGSDFLFEQLTPGEITSAALRRISTTTSCRCMIAPGAAAAAIYGTRAPFPHATRTLAPQIQGNYRRSACACNFQTRPLSANGRSSPTGSCSVERSAQIPGEHVADFLIPRGLGYDYW